MRMGDLLARVMAQRRVLVWFGVAALAAACLGILVTRIELDSDVINMLPKGFESVDGLKIYDRDFEQTRELTFALRCQPQDVDKLDEFAPIFAENLRKQTWCERVLAGSPMETPDGIRDLQSIAIPLLQIRHRVQFTRRWPVYSRKKFGNRSSGLLQVSTHAGRQ